MWTIACGGSSCACWPSLCSSPASSPSGEEEGPLECAGSTVRQCSGPHWAKFPCTEFSGRCWMMAVLMSLSPWQQGAWSGQVWPWCRSRTGWKIEDQAWPRFTCGHLGAHGFLSRCHLCFGRQRCWCSPGVQGQIPSPSPGGQWEGLSEM